MEAEVLYQEARAMSFLLKADFMYEGGLFTTKCWYDAGGCLVDVEVYALNNLYDRLKLSEDDPIYMEAERILSEMNIESHLTC